MKPQKVTVKAKVWYNRKFLQWHQTGVGNTENPREWAGAENKESAHR